MQALTHGSADRCNYQTLEFLGDAVLNLAVSELLFKLGDFESEGDLSDSRSGVVNNRHALSSVAEQLNLLEFAVIGKSFQMTNDSAMRNLQADLIESVVGAIYLDAGYQSALRFVSHQFGDLIDQVRRQRRKDSKSALQEYLQARGKGLPEYRLVNTSGSDHEPVFTVECSVPDLKEPVPGKDRTLKAAEQAAASKAYELLRDGKQ